MSCKKHYSLAKLSWVLSGIAACGGGATAEGIAGSTGSADLPTTSQGGAGAPAARPPTSTVAGSSATGGTRAPTGRPAAAGSGGTPAIAGAAAGSGGASGSAGNAAGGGGTVAAAGSGGSPQAGSAAPSVDPSKPGMFTPTWEEGVGPGSNYTTITPIELAQSELKHPILIWGPGAGAYPEIYKSLLDHIASHGFVIVSYNSTPQGPELNDGIDWIIEESERDGSPFYNKLDTTKIAMGGQSAGSLATFQAGGDERLTTTLHINGGTFDGNVSRLKKPAFFVCGDDPAVTGGDGTWTSDLARPNCDRDFENIEIPVWYGVVIGSSHTSVIDNAMSGMPAGSEAIKQAYLASNVAWLRWQLGGEPEMKALFVGPDCGYCKDSATWLVQQKGLN